MRLRTLGFAAAVALTLAACGADTDNVDDTGPDVPVATPTLEEGSEDDTMTDQPTEIDDDTETEDVPEATGPGDTGETDDAGETGDAPDSSIDLNGYEFSVSLEEAIEISDGETGGGTIHQIGMDWSDGAWVWEIDTMADGQEWELEINATTGEVREDDRDDEDDDERQLELDSVIGHAEAMEIAASEVSGPVTQWELDWDDGRQEYKVEIQDDVDVTIDALSGEILEIDD